ncbi:MAG: lipocalin-like domain-containing protein [Betaproteobacteria bacterium]|nr:MAG: lipocalin-like domain-containing protein [Betaproteobacteria bacterium]
MLSYYGTCSLSEGDRVLTLNIERSSFPNQSGLSFKRVAGGNLARMLRGMKGFMPGMR